MTEAAIWNQAGNIALAVARKGLAARGWHASVDVDNIALELGQEACLLAWQKGEPGMVAEITRGLVSNWSRNETIREKGRVRPREGGEGEIYDPTDAVPSGWPSPLTQVLRREKWDKSSLRSKMAILKAAGECRRSAEGALGISIHKTVWAKL